VRGDTRRRVGFKPAERVKKKGGEGLRKVVDDEG